MTRGYTLAGPVPVVRPPACQDADNNSDDSHTMDDDDRLDYADQDPPSPIFHGNGDHGPMAMFLPGIADWISSIEKALLKSVYDLPVPAQGSPPDASISNEKIWGRFQVIIH